MARTIPLDDLTAEERIELMGRLRDSLDPALAGPITPDVVAELDLREAEADSAPEAGHSWSEIRDDLRRKLKKVRWLRVRKIVRAEIVAAFE